MTIRARLVVFLVATAATGASAQQPTPSFRAGIDIFTVEASVVDGSGKPIADLMAEDFRVTAGGKPRRVRAARFHTGSAIESTTLAGEASPTAPVANSTDSGRIVVFVVDRDSIAPGSERAILEGATAVLDGLRPADASGALELPGSVADLTRDHGRVRAALMRMTGSRPPTMQAGDYQVTFDEALAYERRDGPTIARVVERECKDITRPPGLRNLCPSELQRIAFELVNTGRQRVLSVLSNLTSLAKQLEPLRGTKQIVFLSSGLPFGQDLLPLYNQFVKQAAAAQIVFYAVHLDQPGADVTARKPITSAFGGSEFISGLGNVATMTGGAFFMASGTGAGIFERVSNEIHNFYELAVEMDPDDLTPGTVEIEVKVTRPGGSVRNHRRVLVPARRDAANADRLSEMLRQPVDVNELPVALSVYTMRGDDPTTLRTVIGLDAAGSVGPGEWGFAVFNEGNVVATGRQKLSNAAGPWTAAMSAKLVPGRYRVRAAIVDGANRTGVVERALVAGLRGDQQLQFSDVLVGVADANGRLQPSSRVMQGAALSALIEVISADPATLEKVKTMIEIVPGGSATPVKRFMMAATSSTSAAILTNSVEIPTTDLTAGRYTAIATPTIGEQALGKVSRVFEIVTRP